MKIFIGERFSCGLNYQDEIIYLSLCKKYAITKNVEEADAIVLSSTCSCTEDRINDVLRYIYYVLSKKKPSAKIYLTGCLTRPFKFPEQEAWMQSFFKTYIDYVIPQNKPNLLLQKLSEDFSSLDPDSFGACIISPKKPVARLYISNGCMNNCAFCKTFYQSYPLKSDDIDEIKEKIRYLADHNITMINLIGTNICQYGLDLYKEPKLLEILEFIEHENGITKVNLSGHAYKDAIRFDFAPTIAGFSKVDFISGSLETGSPRLLEMIDKGYTPEEIISYIRQINSQYNRRIDLNIISGLPTETLDDVNATLDVLAQINPYSVEICEYRNSSMLKLSRYPQLTDSEIREHTNIYEEELKRRRVKTTTVYRSKSK